MTNGPDTASQLKRAREKLYEARRAIIELMPEEVARLLSSYPRTSTTLELADWERNTIEAIIERAEHQPTGYFQEERGLCPLCRGESSSPYSSGFAWPNGLRKHLQGSGNAYRCSVMKACVDLAQGCCTDIGPYYV